MKRSQAKRMLKRNHIISVEPDLIVIVNMLSGVEVVREREDIDLILSLLDSDEMWVSRDKTTYWRKLNNCII